MFEEDNTLPLREKMVDGITSADLWTIFTSCPIEKGSPEVYSEYCRAKEKESKKNKSIQKDDGMEM